MPKDAKEQPRMLGFSAQEIAKLIPSITSGDPNDDPQKKPMGVDYSKLTPLLVQAVKDLMLELKDIKKKLN